MPTCSTTWIAARLIGVGSTMNIFCTESERSAGTDDGSISSTTWGVGGIIPLLCASDGSVLWLLWGLCEIMFQCVSRNRCVFCYAFFFMAVDAANSVSVEEIFGGNLSEKNPFLWATSATHYFVNYLICDYYSEIYQT